MAGHENSGDALERLRRHFLEGGAARADYWHSKADLAAYDQTFGQRIGWKWDHVLADLARLGWSPPPGEVLDWGCGSGIAGRAFLGRSGTRGVTRLVQPRGRRKLTLERWWPIGNRSGVSLRMANRPRRSSCCGSASRK
jgi:hypothetical protein